MTSLALFYQQTNLADILDNRDGSARRRTLFSKPKGRSDLRPLSTNHALRLRRYSFDVKATLCASNLWQHVDFRTPRSTG